MIRLAIAGATGRTGRCAVEQAVRDKRFALNADLSIPDDPLCGECVRVDGTEIPVTSTVSDPCDVLIDFTLPAGTMHWLDHCLKHATPMVSGVTGHSDEQSARIRKAGEKIPILQASNFSIGINLLLGLVGKVAAELGTTYDIEIIETHHKQKVDSPSGTALTLVDAVLAQTGRSREDDVVWGRRGETGPRPTGQIGVHAVRMGDVVGRHEVHFSGPGETITLRHEAHSRDAFAAGALRGAAWIVGKPAGIYTMREVIGEQSDSTDRRGLG